MASAASWLLPILIFMIAWEDAVLFKGAGTLARVTGLLVGALWLVKVLFAGNFRKPHPFHFAAYAFMFWNFVSVFWSIDVETTVIRALTYVQLAILITMLSDLSTPTRHCRRGFKLTS